MNFYAGSFNCDIAHIYGANRRCLSSPEKARGAFSEQYVTYSFREGQLLVIKKW